MGSSRGPRCLRLESTDPRSTGRCAADHSCATSAARLHGSDTVRQEPFEHVTIPRSTRRPQRPPLWLHAHDLSDADVTVVDGITTTTVARTLLDLLLRADRLTAIWAGESALRDGLLSPNELGLNVERGARRRGIKRARRRHNEINQLSESPLETGVRLVFDDVLPPAATLQVPITRSDGSVMYRLDMGYEQRKVHIEYEGRSVHEQPIAVLADRERQNAILNAGWRLLRITWSDYRNRPRYIAATTAELLGHRL